MGPWQDARRGPREVGQTARPGERRPDTSERPVSQYMSDWLGEAVRPNLAPKTCERYEAFTRLHMVPYLGTKRLDKLQVRDIRQWPDKLAQVCQCCAQGKDAAKPESKRRCCAIGPCCHPTLSARSRADARDTLRPAYTCAVEDEILSRNPVSLIQLPRRVPTSAAGGPSMTHGSSLNQPGRQANLSMPRSSSS
jgi:hypothetical protein